jgi:hypothetical protein
MNKNVVIIAAFIGALLGCERRSTDVIPPAPRNVQLLSPTDRQPPRDAIPGRDKTWVKLIKKGSGPPVGRNSGDFSGYGYTFYSDDGFDTGTALEMKSWENTPVAERALFAGRNAGDVLRLWDCSSRASKGQCQVFDYTIFGRMQPN